MRIENRYPELQKRDLNLGVKDWFVWGSDSSSTVNMNWHGVGTARKSGIQMEKL
jgi:hypothetical protein